MPVFEETRKQISKKSGETLRAREVGTIGMHFGAMGWFSPYFTACFDFAKSPFYFANCESNRRFARLQNAKTVQFIAVPLIKANY
ncbi:hypothetical protein A7985_10170 [Pseudoalteromonas luteoviolacea]|uniref:Uncharacterized protein n=1 Tax=Pseudoalteromonas luteoviolacea TaxID=43657 RepID=A0A1C0TSJ1_9GAMM|nr:hypothetical protein A7985_10170 [Pseudoalteromonas luteoviolacea]